MVDRFDIKEQRDGSWALVWADTGMPVVLDGSLQIDLRRHQARELCDMMNAIDGWSDGKVISRAKH